MVEKDMSEADKAIRESLGLGDEFDVNKKPEIAKESEEEEKPKEPQEEEPEEEAESEEEDEEDVESEHPTKGIPPKEFNKVRSRVRELEEENRILKEQKALDESSKPPVSEEELEQAAKELSKPNATAEEVNATKLSMKKILDLAWKGAKMSDEDKERLSTLTGKLSELEDKETFSNEWEKFEVSLEKEFPRASSSQIREARKAMDELAHAPQFADKEFDYVYFKNKDIFDEILSPIRKKTFESHETYSPREEGEEKELTFDQIQEEARRQDTWHVSHEGDTSEV